MTIVPSLEASSTTTTRRKRLLSFRFLVLLFLTGIDYLPPSLTYNTASFSTISSSLTSRSITVLPLGIGVLADVVLISTLVEVTETVPPPPVTTASDENVPVVATNTAVATEPPAADTGADTVVAPVTASGADSSQPTATGVGEAKVEVPATAIATYAEAGAAETGTVVSAAAATTDPGTNPASTGLKDANTAPASTHTTAPSGITTSTRRISSPTTGTSTPSPTATDSPQQSFPTYATALASGTAIIAAAGIGTALFLLKRRHRHRRGGGDGGQQPPSKKIDRSSIHKLDILNKPKTKSRGDDLTSWEQPENINEQTNWDRERTPPDPDELRKRMQEEKNTAWRNSKEGSEPIDLGISYAPAAAASTTSFSSRHNNTSPEEQNGGGTPLQQQQQQQQQQEQRYTHEDPSPISMPDELLPVMLPLNIQPHHQPDGQPPPPPTVETINRQDTISPSIYSRDSIGTNFADFYTRINSGSSNDNHHRNGNNSSYHTNLHTIPDDPREALFQTDRYGFQDENHHHQPQHQNFEDRSLRSEGGSHGNEAWGHVPAHRPGFGYNPYDEGFDAA